MEFGQLREKILIQHVDNTVSDHKALVLECALNVVNQSQRRQSRFHFETIDVSYSFA